MDETDNNLVSVCMITYNHELYIKQAITGILMQQCRFQLELVIGDDCSTDKTLAICKELAKANPGIRLFSNNSNNGMMLNFVSTLNACRGKYIAICEGDDYWTDQNKLQKQVDFMENHPEVSLCFTNSKILDDHTKEYRDWPVHLNSRYYEPGEIMIDLVIPTCSVVIRNKINNIISERLLNTKYIMGDLILWLSLAEFGKLFCINEEMVVYRKHQFSAAYRLSLEKQIQLLNQHESIAQDFNFRYKKLENRILSRQYLLIGLKCIIASDKRAFDFLKKAITKYPGRMPASLFYLIKRVFVTDRSL